MLMHGHYVFPVALDLRCDARQVAELGASFHDAYEKAQPYPFIVLDRFLPAEIVERVLADLPERKQVAVGYDRPQERLKVEYKPEDLPLWARALRRSAPASDPPALDTAPGVDEGQEVYAPALDERFTTA